MSKKEQYVRNIQQMAIVTHYPFDFLSNVKEWNSTQTLQLKTRKAHSFRCGMNSVNF